MSLEKRQRVRRSSRAVVSLGSNIEPRADFLARALRALSAFPETRLVRASSVRETEPVGVPAEYAGMKFLNQAAVFETALGPEDFARRMHGVEDALGRRRTVRNGPRTIDIDLVDFDGLRLETPELTLPHPRARERSFVMDPLRELGVADPPLVEILRERARIVRRIRRFFDERDFVEVETPVRIAAPAPEEHIDCPPVCGGGYLRASPELQMKKLLASGMDRIYQIGPCFREGEKGARHNPEFTMIEWYRRNATYLDIKNDLSQLLAAVSDRAGGETSFRTLSVREAYLRYAGWDPWAAWDQDRFDFDMATKIEPAIKMLGGGVFLMDYPPQAASLAMMGSAAGRTEPCPSLPYAERWEFYYDGLELANCFTELCDGDEQSRRFERAKENRKRLGEADYPIDAEFLETLPLVGSAAGVALGVDRLVMVLSGAGEISSVRCGE